MVKKALLIGVSEYQPGLNALPAAVQDVEAIRSVLGNPEMGGFVDSDIKILKNPQPHEVRYAVYDLFANRRKDDLILFYFSGHGIKDEKGNLYLSTHATRKENGKLVKPSAVAASYLHENINDSRSQRQVIILDCCFSGAIASGMRAKDDGSINLQEQLGGRGRAILTSSSSTQYSFEQEGSELSIYTRYLVEGIKTGAADTDEDGQISIDELHEYASQKVHEASPAMTPKFYPIEEGYKILLAKSPKDDPQLKYRREVELRAKENQGKFSDVALRILKLKRDELNISESEAITIQEEVLKPYREYERKRSEYEQVLIKEADKQYPFSQVIQKDLKDYQKYLGLRDEDIAAIQQRVTTAKQVRSESQQDIIETNQEQHTEEEETKDLQPSVSHIQDNTVPEKLLPRILRLNKTLIASIVAIIVLGPLGLFGYRYFAVIPENSAITPVDNLDTIVNSVLEIKHASRLRKLRRKVYEQINLAWNNRQNLKDNLDYRVNVLADSKIISYQALNQLAEQNIKKTPIVEVLHKSNNQISIKNEPIAQFEVKFRKNGVLAVKPTIGYIHTTPELLGKQITDSNLIQELKQKLYNNIWNNWGGVPTFPQNLKYRVALTQDGIIADYEPINKAAFDNFRETPLPKMFAEISQSDIPNIPNSGDRESKAHYQVRFLRNGKLKVEPWQGYPQPKKNQK